MKRSNKQPSPKGDITPCTSEEVAPLVLEPMDVESPVSSPVSIKRRPCIQFLGIYIMLLIPIAVVGLSVLFLYKNDSQTSVNRSQGMQKAIEDDDSNSESKELTLDSGVPRLDAAFALARREVALNIQSDGTFIAGHGWTQLWTRDTSYAVELSLALVYPTNSQKALEACTEVADTKTTSSNTHNNDYAPIGTTWLQDQCGHFGGWPNLSDAIVGAQGAWSLYLATGNIDFLVWAHAMTQNTLRWAERDVYDSTTGLFRGCSSFMESNSGYPVSYKTNGTMVGQTKALSTNVLYYNGYKLAAEMQRTILQLQQQYSNITTANDIGSPYHKSVQQLEERATNLAKAIQSHLWLEDQGYYAYFQDAEGIPVTQMEALGESLLLLAPGLEQNQTRIQQIFDNTYRAPNGIPCLWPQFPNHVESKDNTATYYHNGRIWPFVQGYWGLAAARHGQVDIFAQEVNNLVHLALDNPHHVPDDATFAEFYELNGDFVWQQRRQLWSSAGYLGMIIHGLFGIVLEVDGIRFRPVKPRQLATTVNSTTINAPGMMKLEYLTYRKARLTIILTGYGSVIGSFRMNGRRQQEPVLGADAVDNQLIEISLVEA